MECFCRILIFKLGTFNFWVNCKIALKKIYIGNFFANWWHLKLIKLFLGPNWTLCTDTVDLQRGPWIWPCCDLCCRRCYCDWCRSFHRSCGPSCICGYFYCWASEFRVFILFHGKSLELLISWSSGQDAWLV